MINRVHKKGNAKYTNYQKPNPLKSGANWVHMSSTLFWVTSTKARIRRCIILPLNTTHFLCLINPHTNQYYLTSPSSVLSYYNNLIQVKKNLMSPQQALVSFRVNCPAFHFFLKKNLRSMILCPRALHNPRQSIVCEDWSVSSSSVSLSKY